jgi:hypothetical protein
MATTSSRNTCMPPRTPVPSSRDRPSGRPIQRVGTVSPNSTYTRPQASDLPKRQLYEWGMATTSSANTYTAAPNPNELIRPQALGQRVGSSPSFNNPHTPPATPDRPNRQPVRQEILATSSATILTPDQSPIGTKRQSTSATDLEIGPFFFCGYEGCRFSRRGGKGFTTEMDLRRHYNGTHAPGYRCPLCAESPRIFPRSDLLQR